MADSQGRGYSSLEACDGMQAGSGPVAEKVGDDLSGLAGADGNEVAVGHAQLDLGVGRLVGIEELEHDAAVCKNVLARLGQVIEHQHGGAKSVDGGHCLRVEKEAECKRGRWMKEWFCG